MVERDKSIQQVMIAMWPQNKHEVDSFSAHFQAPFSPGLNGGLVILVKTLGTAEHSVLPNQISRNGHVCMTYVILSPILALFLHGVAVSHSEAVFTRKAVAWKQQIVWLHKTRKRWNLCNRRHLLHSYRSSFVSRSVHCLPFPDIFSHLQSCMT